MCACVSLCVYMYVPMRWKHTHKCTHHVWSREQPLLPSPDSRFELTMYLYLPSPPSLSRISRAATRVQPRGEEERERLAGRKLFSNNAKIFNFSLEIHASYYNALLYIRFTLSLSLTPCGVTRISVMLSLSYSLLFTYSHFVQAAHSLLVCYTTQLPTVVGRRGAVATICC